MEERRARFEQAYRQHAGAVSAYVLRRAPRECAEDVIAETFLVAWRRCEQMPAQPLPWLYAVARRTLANHRRSIARRESLAHRLQLEIPRVPVEPIEERVLEALRSLVPKDRELLMLTAWEGLSAAEAARVLECSPVACRIRLHRARRRLACAIGWPTSASPPLTATEAK